MFKIQESMEQYLKFSHYIDGDGAAIQEKAAEIKMYCGKRWESAGQISMYPAILRSVRFTWTAEKRKFFI